MKTDTFYRALTRPAMFMGVPIMPFFINVGFCVMLAFYISLLLLPVLPISHMYLKGIAKKDEMIFESIFLWCKTKMMCSKNSKSEDLSIIIAHGTNTERKAKQ